MTFPYSLYFVFVITYTGDPLFLHSLKGFFMTDYISVTDHDFRSFINRTRTDQGKRYMKAVLYHMAEMKNESFIHIVDDVIEFTFTYVQDNPLFLLVSQKFRPVFTNEDSYYKDYPSWPAVRKRFAGYALETGKDTIELFAYLNVVLLMSVKAAAQQLEGQSESTMDSIKNLAHDLFGVPED